MTAIEQAELTNALLYSGFGVFLLLLVGYVAFVAYRQKTELDKSDSLLAYEWEEYRLPLKSRLETGEPLKRQWLKYLANPVKVKFPDPNSSSITAALLMSAAAGASFVLFLIQFLTAGTAGELTGEEFMLSTAGIFAFWILVSVALGFLLRKSYRRWRRLILTGDPED